MSKLERLELTVGEDLKLRNAELLRLFPESRTEGGRIDFDRLKLAIGEAIDVGKSVTASTGPAKHDALSTFKNPVTERCCLRPMKALISTNLKIA